MARGVNKVILLGNLGANPEVRHTQDGRPICTLSLATSETWRDRATGEQRTRTEWHRIVLFNENLCRVAEQYLHKGSPIYVEGQLRTRKWQDKSGQDRWTTEVVIQSFGGQLVMLGGRQGQGQGQGHGQGQETERSSAPAEGGEKFDSNLDDDIPF